MALNYEVIRSYRTVQVLSPNTVLNVEEVTAKTIPTGVTFTYSIPVDVYGAIGGQAGVDLLTQISAEIEQLVSSYGVVGGTPVQSIDSSNLITNSVDLTIDYTTKQGNTLTGTATVPMDSFFVGGVGGVEPGVKTSADYVIAVLDSLKTLAGE